MRTVVATRYVMPLREGGSLPGLVESDDLGMYVVKFRGAGQGVKALVAELVAARIAGHLGLPVPDQVLVEIDAALGRTEADPEVAELIIASAGLNFGIDFLPGALDYNPAIPGLVDEGFASRVVWFDALLTNVDRTPRNPNLLIWHGRPWLIDHGATLYQHHGEGSLVARARDPFPMIAGHVLLGLATRIGEADEELANRLDEATIRAAVGEVPTAWLGGDAPATRDQYADYLLERLSPPREFAVTARRAHGA